MSDPYSYVRNLAKIKDSEKRCTSQLKELRQKKKQTEQRLYEYMKKNNLDNFEGYKASKLAPKPKKMVKKKSEKDQDALKIISDVGISDPELFWETLKATQKSQILQNPEDQI